MTDALRRLSDAGVAVWLDDLSRDRLRSGGLAELVADQGVVGVTTNPTIFHAAISGGGVYEDAVGELAGLGLSATEVVRTLTAQDVRGGV